MHKYNNVNNEYWPIQKHVTTPGEGGVPEVFMRDRERGRCACRRPKYSSFDMGAQWMLKTGQPGGSCKCVSIKNIRTKIICLKFKVLPLGAGNVVGV